MEQREQVYAKRKRGMSELCRRYEKCDWNERKHVDQFRFWFDEKNRVAVCMNSNAIVPSNLTSAEKEGQDNQLGLFGESNMREEVR